MALGIVEALEEEKGIDVSQLEHNSTEYLHVLIEAMRLAFADSEPGAIYWGRHRLTKNQRDTT